MTDWAIVAAGQGQHSPDRYICRGVRMLFHVHLPALHEAAILDGASRLQRIWHINIPTILPTIVITLIMRVGHIMGSNADKVLLTFPPLDTDTVLRVLFTEDGLGDTDASKLWEEITGVKVENLTWTCSHACIRGCGGV